MARELTPPPVLLKQKTAPVHVSEDESDIVLLPSSDVPQPEEEQDHIDPELRRYDEQALVQISAPYGKR